MLVSNLSIGRSAGRQRWLALLGWLLLLGGYQWYAWRSGLSALEATAALLRVLATSGWGPLLYVLVYTLRPLLLFPATVLTLGAGFLFGPVLGVLYVIVGSNLSATLAYLVGRGFGGGMLAGQDASSPAAVTVQRYAERMRRSSFTTILTMRLLLLPFDLVNYLAGLLHIGYGPFVLATLLGSIPATIALVLAGASARMSGQQLGVGQPGFDPRVFAASALIFVGSLLLARLLRRHEQRTSSQQAGSAAAPKR